jgi:hypothetical protein
MSSDGGDLVKPRLDEVCPGKEVLDRKTNAFRADRELVINFNTLKTHTMVNSTTEHSSPPRGTQEVVLPSARNMT